MAERPFPPSHQSTLPPKIPHVTLARWLWVRVPPNPTQLTQLTHSVTHSTTHSLTHSLTQSHQSQILDNARTTLKEGPPWIRLLAHRRAAF